MDQEQKTADEGASSPRNSRQQPQPSSSAQPSIASSMSQQAPTTLPPIQHFDVAQHNMQQQHQPQPQYGPPPLQQQHAPSYPPPPPPPPPPQQQQQQYQYQNGGVPAAPMPLQGVAPNGQNGSMMRFPIPPVQHHMDARQMSGGRHKKEIKRRTKTGCLTCRKRRIKCDEAHPTCRNCQKSKRECLGYDPVFRPQPGPANIQPAPAGSNTPQSHPNAPPATLPSNPYPQSQVYPGPGATYAPAAGPPAMYSAEQRQSGFDHGTSLDPALSSGDPSAHMVHNSYAPALQPQRKVRPVQIDDLFSLNDIPPRYNLREAPPPLSEAVAVDVEQFYRYHYAEGLNRIFETTWYSARGSDCLKSDTVLHDFVAQCAERFKTKNEATDAKPLRSLEARLVWQLAAMPRFAASTANGNGTESAVYELLPRIDTVENLLTGQFLEPGRIPPPPQQPPPTSNERDAQDANKKYNELYFWHHLARFVAVRDDTPSGHKDVSDALMTLRGTLNMLENRDVLYSMAIARHIGGRMSDFHPQRHLVTSTTNPDDPVNKLKVAQQFVENEDQRGTTQVIQRMCSMSIRGWMLQKQ